MTQSSTRIVRSAAWHVRLVVTAMFCAGSATFALVNIYGQPGYADSRIENRITHVEDATARSREVDDALAAQVRKLEDRTAAMEHNQSLGFGAASVLAALFGLAQVILKMTNRRIAVLPASEHEHDGD